MYLYIGAKSQALPYVRESFFVLSVQLRGDKHTECVSEYFCNTSSVHKENTQMGKQLEKYMKFGSEKHHCQNIQKRSEI
jgi:hypothetical protein